MYYKDDFNVTFKEESAFYRYLDDVEKRAEWFRAQSKDLKVEAVTKDSICSPIGNINLEYLKDDTLKNSGLMIKTPDRSCYLGISAVKSLKGRARIDGKALAELDKETLAYILNECLKVSKGKSLLRFCEGKVRAVFICPFQNLVKTLRHIRNVRCKASVWFTTVKVTHSSTKFYAFLYILCKFYCIHTGSCLYRRQRYNYFSHYVNLLFKRTSF